MKTALPTFRLAIALLLASITTSPAQILYSRLASVDADPSRFPRYRFELRQVNGNGTGDTAFGLTFASDATFSAWSRDGGLFAISAQNPNRPNDRSHNIYAINPVNGAVQPITLNQSNPPDPRTGAFEFKVAQYPAFSPDRRAMAVSSTIVHSSGQVGQTHTTPVLEVFSTATPTTLAIVRVYSARINHHGGEGVDWHPAQNRLVAPVDATAPYQSDPSRSGEVTALCLLDPVDRAIEQGRFRQITFPRANENSATGDLSSEHDYLPKVSPNGGAVAYVRSFQNLSFSRGGADPNVQSLRILDLQTGAETQVLGFRQGVYVSSLDWSPDGTALVFDLGQQATMNGQFVQTAARETSEIYIVNANGTGLRRLRGTGAAYPAWKPIAAQSTRSETERLAVTAISAAQHGRISDAQLSGGAGTLVSRTSVGSFVTYNRPVPAAGTYRVRVRVKTGPKRGKFQLTIGGVKIGSVQDQYSAAAQYQLRDLGLVNFASGGDYQWRFTVTGKNPNSTGTTLAFDAIDLIPQ